MNYYQKNANDYINKTKDVDMSSEIKQFLEFMPKNGRILDIGFGSGRDSLTFRKLGYDVVSIDPCKEFCDYGKSLGLNVKNIKVQDIDFNNEFDGVWACASLLHLTSKELPLILSKIKKSMNQNSSLYCSFKFGDFEGYRDDRYYLDMTLDRMKEYIKETNLKIKKYWYKEDSLNRDNQWISFILK